MASTPAVGFGPVGVGAIDQPSHWLFERLASASARYAFAIAVGALAVGLALTLKVVTNADHLLLLLLGVVIIAWWTDLSTALAAVVATGCAAVYVVFDPVFSFSVDTVSDLSKLGFYLLLAPTVAFAAERIRSTESARNRAYQEVRTLNAQLRKALEAKDEFVAFLAHELRTPLTVIAGNADILVREEVIDNQSQRSAAQDIQQEAERLRESIEDLLILARLDRGDVLPSEPVLIGRLLGSVVEQCRERLTFARTVTFAAAPTLVAEAVPTYLRHTIENLISNADKYSPPGLPIDVVATADSTMAQIDVIDRGPGIPYHERDRIFTAFYRSPATANIAGGAGIGLTVTRKLVEAQGGEIRVFERAGGGTVFRVTLPLAYSRYED